MLRGSPVSARFYVFMTLAAGLLSPFGEAATTLPGFQEEVVTTALLRPTSMAFTPDGRLFVTEQGGRIRILKDGQLLATPLATFAVDTTQSRGLLGLALDPDFATN